jgi:long-chain fatty acid transport protein
MVYPKPRHSRRQRSLRETLTHMPDHQPCRSSPVSLSVLIVAGTIAIFCALSPAYAQTPRLQGQGAAAAGMGNAFVAQADDPSALHYNPAGMTQLHGFQNMFGAALIGGVTTFTGPTGATVTGDRNASVAWPPPGHIYLTANLKDLGMRAFGDLTAGVGLASPFGSLTRYPNDGPFRPPSPSPRCRYWISNPPWPTS